MTPPIPTKSVPSDVVEQQVINSQTSAPPIPTTKTSGVPTVLAPSTDDGGPKTAVQPFPSTDEGGPKTAVAVQLTPQPPLRIVVVGGGIAGLCTTIELARFFDGARTEIYLLEAEDRLGGQLETTRVRVWDLGQSCSASSGAMLPRVGAGTMRPSRRASCGVVDTFPLEHGAEGFVSASEAVAGIADLLGVEMRVQSFLQTGELYVEEGEEDGRRIRHFSHMSSMLYIVKTIYSMLDMRAVLHLICNRVEKMIPCPQFFLSYCLRSMGTSRWSPPWCPLATHSFFSSWPFDSIGFRGSTASMRLGPVRRGSVVKQS